MSWIPTEAQQAVLTANDDLMVIGGAGSGKTTVALEKARRFADENEMASDQRVLFLSFSNTAVRRIQEAAGVTLTYRERRNIAVTTFHSFCHEVLRAHWRLAGLGAPFQLLAPGAIEVMKTRLPRDEDLKAAILAREREGRVGFDRYAPLAVALFDRARTLRKAYASAYPLVIVDEYQDTADDEHELVRRLAQHGQLICCGDPKQRIYGFRRGTVDDRIDQAEADFSLLRITLTHNHRSAETDIERVAASILRCDSRIKPPVSVGKQVYYRNSQLATLLKQQILQLERKVRSHTRQPGKRVSIAVMCFRNQFVGTLSQLLTSPSGSFKRPFRHRILLRQEGLAIAWEAVAAVMTLGPWVTAKTARVLEAAAQLDRLEGGGSVSRIAQAEKLEGWAAKMMEGTLSGHAKGAHQLRESIGGLVGTLSGDPTADSLRVANAFRGLKGNHLRHVVRLLDLRPFGVNAGEMMTELAESHRGTGGYPRVEDLVARRLVQERLQGDVDAGSGRVLMTMHKCKGREFDAAIVVDGRNQDSIVLPGERRKAEQPESRRLLATSLQRARFAALVFTNGAEQCPLIPF